MYVAKSSAKKVVFRCEGEDVLMPITVRSVAPPADASAASPWVLEAAVGADTLDAVAAAERAQLADLRKCSAQIFHSFRDEYDGMLRSACRGGDPATVVLRTRSSAAKTLVAGEDYDVVVAPHSVVVTPGTVQIEWSVEVFSEEMSGFEPPVAIRANKAVKLSRELRDRLDATIDELGAGAEGALEAAEDLLARCRGALGDAAQT